MQRVKHEILIPQINIFSSKQGFRPYQRAEPVEAKVEVDLVIMAFWLNIAGIYTGCILFANYLFLIFYALNPINIIYSSKLADYVVHSALNHPSIVSSETPSVSKYPEHF